MSKNAYLLSYFDSWAETRTIAPKSLPSELGKCGCTVFQPPALFPKTYTIQLIPSVGNLLTFHPSISKTSFIPNLDRFGFYNLSYSTFSSLLIWIFMLLFLCLQCLPLSPLKVLLTVRPFRSPAISLILFSRFPSPPLLLYILEYSLAAFSDPFSWFLTW